MFLQGNAQVVAAGLNRLRERGSILDAVREHMHRCQSKLGERDRRQLDQYVTSVRKLEERLTISGEWEQKRHLLRATQSGKLRRKVT